MTSATSSAKKYPAVNLFRKTLKKQIPISVLVSAFGLLLSLGAPIRELLWMTTHLGVEEIHSVEYEFSFSAVASFCVAASLVFILLLFNFNFLFSKKAGDVFQALPLTRNGLLFSRGLPALVGGAFSLTVSFVGFGIINYLPRVDSLDFALLAESYLLALLFLVCLFAAMLIVVVCSGGILDAIIALVAFNVAPLILTWVLISSADSTAYGLSFSETILIYTTPFVFTFFKLASFTEPHYGDEHFMVDNAELVTVWTILGTVVLTAIVLVGATVFFKKRKAETAGSAYSFKFIPFLLSLLVSMVGGYLCGILFTGDTDLLEVTYWIFFCIGAMLCSVAFGMIISRGFKKIKRSLVNGIIAIALLIVITLSTNLIVLTEEKKVPEAEKVESVALSYREIIYTDPEDIKTITELHKSMVANLRTDLPDVETPDILTNLHGFEVVYKMKNGNTVRRNYGFYLINDRGLYRKLLGLMQNETFFEQYGFMTEDVDKVVFDIVPHNESKQEEFGCVLTTEETKTFLQIFRNELMRANETVLDEPCYNVGVHAEGFYEDLWIPDSFTETMDYLKMHKEIVDEEILEK